jgi:hypothetical protein
MSSTISSLRYKAYRLTKRIFLGSLGGGALGTNICRSLEEGRASPNVARHIAECRKIAPACVQTYPFPEEFPPEFPREVAFDAKFVYRLSDVVVAPESGLVWLPGGPILQESAGSLPRLFNGRIRDTLRTPVRLSEPAPIIVFPVFGYYHVLFDVLANVLHALSFVPEAKILLPPRRPHYVDSILNFLEISENRRIVATGSVRANDLVFSPTWVNGGFIPPADLDRLRRTILPAIKPTTTTTERIYISRSRSPNRSLKRENEMESALSKHGIRICYFEEMSIAEQFETIHQSSVVVAPHGAGLANLVAAQPKTAILELLSRNWFNTCYAKLAVQIGCQYNYLETIRSNGEYEAPIDAVLERIDQL